MGKLKRAIGLMSGTSMDGIDVALIETDGMADVRRGPAFTYPYSESFRARLRQACAEAVQIRRRGDRPGVVHIAEQYLTDLHAEAVLHFIEDVSLKADSIDVIGFHGHTVLHRPLQSAQPGRPRIVPASAPGRTSPRVMSVQIGDGARLARMTGIDVVYDLRANDVASGGQGAPLVPVYHAALAAHINERPIAVLNIGGVANVTWIGRNSVTETALDESLLSFDTGPGNALLDDWMLARTGAARDEDGESAAKGVVHDDIVSAFLRQPYFAERPPKSLDRNSFDVSALAALSTEDGAATLTAFTAAAIARAEASMPEVPELWIVGGGGRRNRTLMQMLAGRVANAIAPAEAVGLDGDSIEAEAWAYLAVRSLAGLPLTFPRTTGVPAPTTGGVLAKARG